jgi:DNA polymerase III epsilon subunit-like protein
MEFFFDTETTGLPIRKGNKIASYKNLEQYDSARIVSISWIITQNQKVVGQAYYVIKPDGFTVPQESTNIHGISHEEAMATGCSIQTVFDQLKATLPNCSTLVAHNISFDINVLKSELHRYQQTDILDILEPKHLVCTMRKGKEVLKTRVFPKLGALYKGLYNEEIENAHNAQYDTLYCYKCYIKMFPLDTSMFFFGDRGVKLTDTQKDIVYEDHDKNMLVIACAGAGKTLTVICRVKHLIESGVSEDSIMLTTFTRDAANDMKNKLFDIMGYTPAVTVGTIDSIAWKYSSNKRKELQDVSEYGHNFLEAITKDPSIIAQYKYIFVDEFQDINDVQFQIIKVFSDNGCKVFGVGDDAQNIYTFRGSKVEFILNFEKHFPNSTTKFLMENFRSTKEIINMANASMDKNENSIPKKMCSGTQSMGPKPHVQFFSSQANQNTNIIDKISELIENGVAEHEIAILSPINQPLYMIEELLTKKGIKNVYLDGKCDVKTSKKPWHVCMCTIHKSKGLEWEYVFMTSMSDEIIPKNKTSSHIDESRRLFYVGITRARKELYIYYNVMIKTSPYVTRYVTEIDRDLYTTEDMESNHFGISELEITPSDLSVTKLIENIDGGDYIKMKELGIIPIIDKRDIKKQKIYESFSYSKIIESDDLYSDFGIFIEKIIKRDIAVMLGNKDMCQDKHTLMCLANIKLDPQQYIVYNQYKNNFKENIKRVKPYFLDVTGNKYKIKSILEHNSKFINEAHLTTLLRIIMLIRQRSEYYHIEPHEVPIFSKTFLPEGFEKLMEKSMKVYRDVERPTDDNVVKNIWEMAKCKKIVTEYRRRLLYKNIDVEALQQEYAGLYGNIRTKMMDFFLGMIGDASNVAVEEELEIKEGIYGELDLRIGDVVIDYKTSINDDISMQWLLQLLCYKVLSDFNNKKISKIGILNSLRGWYGEIDVSTWDKHHELVAYLLNKRQLRNS